MEYFVSHLPAIFGAAIFVALCAVSWWYLLERNARLKRERAEARKAAAAQRKGESARGEPELQSRDEE